MPLFARDVVEILHTLNELGYQRFRFEQGDVRLEVDATSDGGSSPTQMSTSVPHPPSAQPTPESAPAAPVAAIDTTPPREGLVSVDSPMTGTFYRASSPTAPPFVEVGSQVAADDVVCLVDVMKLFNSIQAGYSGTVVAVCAENEAQVKAGQPLMWIEPAS